MIMSLLNDILNDIFSNSLQRVVNYLLDWSLNNKMNFHHSKCKVLMVSKCLGSCKFG